MQVTFFVRRAKGQTPVRHTINIHDNRELYLMVQSYHNAQAFTGDYPYRLFTSDTVMDLLNKGYCRISPLSFAILKR